MANDTPQLPDPDAPWLKPEDVKRETTYVYRVRYLTNQIEVLVLLSKSNHKLLVREPSDGSFETWIEGRDVYDTFDAAREELARLNQERVEMVAADLQRAKDKLDRSLAMFLDDGDDDEDDDGALDALAPHQLPGGDNIWN